MVLEAVCNADLLFLLDAIIDHVRLETNAGTWFAVAYSPFAHTGISSGLKKVD